ncbi:thaumatin-like protein 1 [Miscanthus floridulus]|uniref:thaumatin-like protein 1 n=1 Tax=Miscanthus floridulus TaxID=154761 RepID=UPI00345950AE
MVLMLLPVLWCPDSDDFAASADEQHDILNIKNNCSFSVAPVIAPKPGSSPLDFTPYQFMGYDYLENIALPHRWSGLIWDRTDCSTDGSGKFTCATGDCGSGRLGCDRGARPAPAATVAVLALGGKGGTDTYHISVADGACPADQQMKASDGRVVACKPSVNSGPSNIACTTANTNGPASSSSSCAVVDNSYTVTFCPDNSEFEPNNPSSTSN